jgi:hypothetical protein
VAFPTTGILDDFNRANETPIASPWAGPLFSGEGQMNLTSNALKFSTTSGIFSGSYLNATYGPDAEAYITMATLGADTERVNLMARIQNPGQASINGYMVTLIINGSGNDTVRIRKTTAGSNSTLGADITSEDFLAGDKLGIEIVGTTITAYRYTSGAWASIGSRTDSDFSTTGYIGMEGDGTTAVFDDLGGGTMGTTIAWITA